jgi:CMP-N-acetylneuraminic acid synthetase
MRSIIKEIREKNISLIKELIMVYYSISLLIYFYFLLFYIF